MKDLEFLHFGECNQIDDLSPLAGMGLRVITLTPRCIKKGWEVLWDMKSLDTVNVGRNAYRVAVFRKLYERGEFRASGH
jgi:hypothetical protein